MNIKSVRERQGLSQEALGAAIGVTGRTIIKWESGETAPNSKFLDGLCQALNCSVDELLGRAS